MNTALLTYMMLAAANHIPHHNDPLAGIDIEKEYQLIQHKRSRLSRMKRDEVCRRYLKNN